MRIAATSPQRLNHVNYVIVRPGPDRQFEKLA
jgi:hypothetical protein